LCPGAFRFLPQKYRSDEIHHPACSHSDNGPQNACHAEECVNRIESLREIQGDTIRQEDERIENELRGNQDRGKDIEEDGIDDQEWEEKKNGNNSERPHSKRKGP
jgi:hypothetical protein